MYCSWDKLDKRMGKSGTPRNVHLGALVREFEAPSTSLTNRRQVLANLANFAYDPINFGFLRELGVVGLLVDVVERDEDPLLTSFAVGGLCNLACERGNRDAMTTLGVPPLLARLFGRRGVGSLATVYCLGTLLQLEPVPGESVDRICLELAEGTDGCVANLATLYLNKNRVEKLVPY